MAWSIIGIIPNKTTRIKTFLNVTKLLWLPEETSFSAIPHEKIAIISCLKIRWGTTHNNLVKKMQKIITSSSNPFFLWKLWSDNLGQLNNQSWQPKLITCTNWRIQDKLLAGFYCINQPKINDMETHRRHKSPHPKDPFGENGFISYMRYKHASKHHSNCSYAFWHVTWIPLCKEFNFQIYPTNSCWHGWPVNKELYSAITWLMKYLFCIS